MGTGKSTAGRILARRLRYDFVDTDHLIEDRHGPIPDIFEHEGEAAFREIEHDVAVELGKRTDIVISTGGGMLVDPANVVALGDALIFCLTATVDEILQRVSSGRQRRPLIDDAEDPRATIEALLERRAEAYSRFPEIRTDGMTPSNVASLLAVRAAIAAQAAEEADDT